MLETCVTANISALTKGARFTNCDVHVEVCMDYDKQSVDIPPHDPTDPAWELAGRVILEFIGPNRITVDKPLLTRLLRSHPGNPWGAQLKVEKRALPLDWQTPQELPVPVKA